jgi:lipopolysaccharide/colanic/teichoic acid biosynthesis glycosyltransferase
MVKRLFDVAFAFVALLITSPILLIAAVLIWAHDRHSPIFAGTRVGRFDRDFRMFKLRTMIPDAHNAGGTSTAASDLRLTPLGTTLRRFKLDELPQFLNVLKGDMSIVGPRPNVRAGGVDRYTSEERNLLAVRPGITDLASIVFSDEGEILRDSADPDALYNAVIRPWKSRLALLYLEHSGLMLDLTLVGLTALSLFSRRAALRGIDAILERWQVSQDLRESCTRSEPLPIGEPPGQVA